MVTVKNELTIGYVVQTLFLLDRFVLVVTVKNELTIGYVVQTLFREDRSSCCSDHSVVPARQRPLPTKQMVFSRIR